MTFPLHNHERGTKGFALSAEYYGAVNDARETDGSTTFDGLVVAAAFDAVSETEPTIAYEKLDVLIALALAMQDEIGSVLDEDDDRFGFDEDEA